jgi:tetratricopeptide (TPR) repeat protein
MNKRKSQKDKFKDSFINRIVFCKQFKNRLINLLIKYRPSQVKWQLMVASCYRRSGNYAAALDEYKKIHHKFPDNIECMSDFYYWKYTLMKRIF